MQSPPDAPAHSLASLFLARIRERDPSTANKCDPTGWALLFLPRYTRTVSWLIRLSLIGLWLSCLPLQLATAQVSALGQQYEAAQRTLTDGNYPEVKRTCAQLGNAHPEIAEIQVDLGT